MGVAGVGRDQRRSARNAATTRLTRGARGGSADGSHAGAKRRRRSPSLARRGRMCPSCVRRSAGLWRHTRTGFPTRTPCPRSGPRNAAMSPRSTTPTVVVQHITHCHGPMGGEHAHPRDRSCRSHTRRRHHPRLHRLRQHRGPRTTGHRPRHRDERRHLGGVRVPRALHAGHDRDERCARGLVGIRPPNPPSA